MRLNHYSADNADRAAKWRKDPDWIARKLADPQSQIALLWQNRNLIRTDEAGLHAHLMTVGEAGDLLRRDDTTPILLGLRDDRAVFAVAMPTEEPPDIANTANQTSFADLRSVGPAMVAEEAAILAHARGMVYWQSRHRFCGLCGYPTVPKEAGHVLLCTNPDCQTSHFPRTDPAVIMLIIRGEHCLLGRQAQWPEGMYSTLAGFVEPGESLEDAVRREVFEEAGVPVSNVVYHSSQPWPFPSSIMLGFYGTTDQVEITPDLSEIQHAAWFTREDILQRKGGLTLPPSASISRHLIQDWLEDPAV